MELFLADYGKILAGDTNTNLVEEILRVLPELSIDTLRSNTDIDDLVKIDSPELFLVMLQKMRPTKFELESVVRNLLDTPNRAIHIRTLNPVLAEKIIYFGDNLEKLRIQSLDYLAQGDNQVCRVYLTKDFALQEALLHGFVPINLVSVNKLRMEYPTVPYETLEYMQFSEIVYSHYPIVNIKIHGYQMFTEEYAKTLVTKPTESTSVLRWTYPNLLYKSHRLKTDMAMFRTPFSNTDLEDYTSLLLREGVTIGKYYVPVIRYASSKETGLYHREIKAGVCGTFFYYEPESTTYLTGTRFLVAQTKCSAAGFILNNYKLHELEDTINNYLHEPINSLWEEGKLKPDLMYTPEEMYDLNYYDEEALRVPQFPVYCGKLLDLYAKEDDFDQPLCNAASSVGIEIVILTRMVGSKQIVTEVLDTRSRLECFKNLVFKN